MPTPRKYNPVDVEITQMILLGTPTGTPRDRDFDEPRSGQTKRYATTLALEAQIVYGSKDEKVVALTGDPGNTAGHLTFRKVDLDKSGIILAKGDKIKKIAGVSVDYKIVEVRPSGHLRRKANLLLAFFASNEDTNPTIRR